MPAATFKKTSKVKPLKAENYKMWKSVWIDRFGNVYAVDDCCHFYWICENTNANDLNFGVCQTEQKGWIHISFGNVFIQKQPTKRQYKALEEWMMYHCPEENNVRRFVERMIKLRKGEIY